ncbi:unnamed protein product [Trichobilharzia regenti]|nr:unnamed protein product [Trichobilharzia regenti]
MLLADDSYTILHLLRPRTDKSQNIRFAAHEKYLMDSCRKVLDCFKDLNEEESLSDIESFLTPLFQSSKGPWTSDAQTCENPPINKTLSLELPQKEVKRMKCNEDNSQSKFIGVDLMGQYVKFFATALRAILLKAYSVNQATPCGYIFGKPDPSAEGLRR